MLQRVRFATVAIEGEVVAQIGAGLLLLVGVAADDSPHTADRLANKIASLRVFPDGLGRFDRSVLDTRGDALVVSQFTLLAETRRGRRPSFTLAARPEIAAPLVDRFAERLRTLGVPTVQGRFGAQMAVELLNDGPVTIIIDSTDDSR